MSAISTITEIKEEVLFGYDRAAKSDLGYNTIGMIKLYGEPVELKKINDYVKSTFNTYRPRITKWGDHEMHIWTSEDYHCVHLTPNAKKNKEEGNKKITDLIRKELETTFQDLGVTAYFGMGYELCPDKIEEFLMNYTIDLNELQLEKFNVIQTQYVGFPELSNKALSKYAEINAEFLEMLLDKKVVINGTKGKFKKVSNGDIGFFKLRARTQYYRYELKNIQTLEFY